MNSSARNYASDKTSISYGQGSQAVQLHNPEKSLILPIKVAGCRVFSTGFLDFCPAAWQMPGKAAPASDLA